MKWWRRRVRDRDIAREVHRELQHHVEERRESLMAQGLRPNQAIDEALRRFGDPDTVQHLCEKINATSVGTRYRNDLIHSLAHDLRYALRGFRRTPVVTATVILTFALGIGATTAIFTVVDALILRPMPYGEPDRLATLWRVDEEAETIHPWYTMDDALVWLREIAFLDGVALYTNGPLSLVHTGRDEPMVVTARPVTANLFDVLRVPPAHGRSFVPADAEPGNVVAILNHDFWAETFLGDTSVIGSPIRLGDATYTIVGVMPRGFKFQRFAPDMWVPLSLRGTSVAFDIGSAEMIARLPYGMDHLEAQERLVVLGDALRQAEPALMSWTLRPRPVDLFRVSRNVSRAMWVLAGAVGLMLLLATVNVVHVLVAHGLSRRDEIAIRTSLGASRIRLGRQLLTEVGVLAMASAAASWLVTSTALTGIMRIAPDDLTVYAPNLVGLDGRALGFTFATTLILAASVGTFVAMHLLRVSAGAWGAMTPRVGRARGANTIRSGIVVTEVAVSMTLLVGAALLVGSFVRLISVDNGYDADRVVRVSLGGLSTTYPDRDQRLVFRNDVLDHIRALPGVEAASATIGAPPDVSFTFGVQIEAENRPIAENQPGWVPFAQVQPEFFDVFQIPIARGRNFLTSDDPNTTTIIDRDLARFLWGDDDPLGRRFRLGDETDWLTVVGLIDDVKLMGPDDRTGAFDFFYPLSPTSTASTLVIRTRGDARATIPAIKRAVHTVNPNQPVTRVETIRDALGDAVSQPKFLMTLISIMAGLALTLAAVGTYGVFAVIVGQRTRELGIRKALGAPSSALLRQVIGYGVGLAIAGCTIGLAAAVYISRFLEQLLFGVRASDPTLLLGVTLLMLGMAVGACLVPARRASRVDPLEILRSE